MFSLAPGEGSCFSAASSMTYLWDADPTWEASIWFFTVLDTDPLWAVAVDTEDLTLLQTLDSGHQHTEHDHGSCFLTYHMGNYLKVTPPQSNFSVALIKSYQGPTSLTLSTRYFNKVEMMPTKFTQIQTFNKRQFGFEKIYKFHLHS